MGAGLEEHRQRFEHDPGDGIAFEALEEDHFLHSRWDDLATLYEKRLGAESLLENPKGRARLQFRLGQLHEERRQETDRAVECFREAARLDPRYRPPLRRLREIYAERGQWEMCLQVGELEAGSPMREGERAALLTDLGRIWHAELGDAHQALTQFAAALAAEPGHQDALLGQARALEALEQNEDAARSWTLLAKQLEGSARAEATLALARLHAGPLGDEEQAFELYRRALTEDPASTEAIEGLVSAATAREQWPLVAELHERRFDQTQDDIRKLAVALEAGRLQLERLQSPHEARLWFERAHEIFPEDPQIHLALAQVAEMLGDDESRGSHREQAAEFAHNAAPSNLLVEAAERASGRGDDEEAVIRLRRALERSPADRRIIDALGGTLQRLGREDELVQFLEERASAQDPQDRAAALAELGAFYEERGDDPVAAREAYERGLEVDPAHPAVLAGLERLYRKDEAWDELRAMLETARSRAEGSERVAVLCSLGELLEKPFEERDGARETFVAALALDSTADRALQGLERLAVASGDRDAILAAFEREAAVTTDPERLAAIVWELVPLLEQAERPEEALHWIDRLLAARPADRRALETAARLHESLGDAGELCRTLERLDGLLEGSDRAANLRHRATLLVSQGAREEAIAVYQSALDVDPEDLEAYRALVGLLDEFERHADRALVLQGLAERIDGEERAACLESLAETLVEKLGDLEGGIAALRQRLELPDADTELGERLEDWLERAGRYEELAAAWAERRETLPGRSEEADALDLRRAAMLLDRLDRADEAREIFEGLAADHAEAAKGFERALRQTGDTGALVALLERRAGTAADAGDARRLELERAVLLDEQLARSDEARTAYEGLAASDVADVAAEAGERLERLLEREEDFAGLREHWRARLDSDEGDVASLHERIAELSRDRLDDVEAAIDHLEAAAELEPGRASVWRSLARLYERDGRPSDELRALEAELATAPDSERELSLRSRAAELRVGTARDLDAAERHYRRVLELDPAHSRASDFLVERLAGENRHEELAAVLTSRLVALRERNQDDDEGMRISLGLRLGALQGGPLGDVEAAIATLEATAAEPEGLLVAAEPLGELLRRSGRDEPWIDLCRRAAEASDFSSERAEWQVRLGEGLGALGRTGEAAEAYRAALAARPEDREAQAALRSLYRDLGEWEPLARMLEAELERTAGEDEVPLRLDLASLQAGPLEQPGDALTQLRRVLELRPAQPEALEQATELADRLGQSDSLLELLDAALRVTRNPLARRDLHARRGRLLRELDRVEEAADAFREALRVQPSDRELRAALRDAAATLGRTEEALECIAVLAGNADLTERVALLQSGAELAVSKDPDAALPWLTRLHAVRQDDPETIRRMALLHGAAGREPERLRCLEAELALSPGPERSLEIQLERARSLEATGAPGRAATALEEARRMAPRDAELLGELARLYRSTGRAREEAEVLAARIEMLSHRERAAARRRRAELAGGPLADPRTEARELWQVLSEGVDSTRDRSDTLRALGAALRRAGDLEGWSRAAEAELQSLDPKEPAFLERRRTLHQELATTYRSTLARSDAAAGHLRSLLAADPEGLDAAGREAAEIALLDQLRAEQNHLELEGRLTERLERNPDDTSGWLELARVRSERLHASAAAAEAYRQVLARDPENAAALRELRDVLERLGAWEELAGLLEREVALAADRPDRERAALWRRLGEVSWHRLDSTTRASRAFASALEVDPGDLQALRSLQRLFESMEDFRGAADLYESEIEVLGEDEPGRRQSLWLRVARVGERADDGERARRAYGAAADLGPLPPDERRAWAELEARLGHPDQFVEIFAGWCDDPNAEVQAEDELRLALALESLDRPAEAATWTERALEREPDNAQGWDQLARLRERDGDPTRAAEAHVRAAEAQVGPEAARRLRAAAGLLEERDDGRARMHLLRAVEIDAADADGQAALARVAERLQNWGEAEQAAGAALDLDSASGDLARETRFATAMIGARAARQRDALADAAHFYSRALAVEASDLEALLESGRVLYELKDLPAAVDVLERWLAAADDAPERGEVLCQLGEAREAQGDDEGGLARYREALDVDGSLEEAHAGLVRVYERAGRLEEAVSACSAWAACATDPAVRAERLVQAAAYDAERAAPDCRAEALLREALDADPGNAAAWVRMTQLLDDDGRVDELLRWTEDALPELESGEARCVAALARGRALEARGEIEASVEAYRIAAEADGSGADAALACARGLRSLGDWQGAADALASFAEGEQEGGAAVAEVLHQLGRLRAGPLEDVEGAIQAYRRAAHADPARSDVKEALADLLVHFSGLRDEAVARNREILEQQPARAASLRGLLRVSLDSGSPRGVQVGLGVLRALGLVSSEERSQAPATLPFKIAQRPRLADPLFECVRAMAQNVTAELTEALGASPGVPAASSEDPQAAFRNGVLAAEGELTVPALVPLETEELRTTLLLVAEMALDPDSVSGDGNLVNSLSSALGRRARRRVRKLLDGTSIEEIRSIDFGAWRAEVRDLARARALDAVGGDLRLALVTLLADRPEGAAASEAPVDSDLTPLLPTSEEAQALLRRVVLAWTDLLA